MAERAMQGLADRLLELDGIIDERDRLADSRFGTDLNTEQFVKSMQNENTSRNTSADVRLFRTFIAMKWGDIELHRTSTGEEYLEYTERATKTRTGSNSDARPFMPKMFAMPGNDRCPVSLYKEYVSRRPQDMNMDPDSSFYLSVKTGRKQTETWYSTQNMGKNTLGIIMKSMSERAGIQGRKVNHSARKSTVTTLLHKCIEPTQIMQVTGHKNVHSDSSPSTIMPVRRFNSKKTDVEHFDTFVK